MTTSAFSNASSNVIRGVLYFSPSCPACHAVMEEILPPLVEKYGDQLDIVGIDISIPAGQQLYMDMVSTFGLPDERLGVPTMIVGSHVLFGRYEIEEQLPGLIEQGLTARGIDWPTVPGLAGVLAAQPSSETSSVNQNTKPSEESNQPGFIKAFLRDPVANSVAVIVLIALIVIAIAVLISYLQGADHKFVHFPDFIIPLFALAGLGIAGYLSYVEFAGAKAVCGPVGNCNSVQESSYARLFGVLPIGLLGVAGYFVILATWLAKKIRLFASQNFFTLALWGLAWFGVLFSIYLTTLEPFVIGATCAWCIGSAIIMGLMLLATTAPAKEALRIDYDLDDEEEFQALTEKTRV